METPTTRRELLRAGLGAAAAALLPRTLLAAEKPPAEKKSAPEVGPIEDLMREHGLLERVLLVYEECARRLVSGRPAPADVLPAAAGLVRRFVEDYHERQEEQSIFPLFSSGALGELVAVLRRQHDAGRALTTRILDLSSAAKGSTRHSRAELPSLIASFCAMYRPHAAREDTVLFPAVHRALGREAFDRLGEVFEKNERKRFGENGFEKAVASAAELERELGLFDLAKFTPSAAAAPPPIR